MAVIALSRPLGSVSAAPANRLPYADFFRALAIFYVFMAHAGSTAREPLLFHHVALSEAVSIFDGVAMLFCLSGYLLAAPFLRAYLATPGTLPLTGPYLLARFLRIYPLYAIAVLAIAAFLTFAGTPPSLNDVVVHLAMLQNASPATIQSLSGPLWTMPVDVEFYLALPVCFALLARAMRDRSERSRLLALWIGIALTVGLSIAYRFAVVHRWSPIGLDDQLFIVDQLPGMAALFAFGIAARLGVMLMERAGIRPAATIVLALVALAIGLRWLQYGTHGAWLHLASAGGHAPALFAAFDQAIGGAGCALLLIAAHDARYGRIGNVLRSPAVTYAAAISYGLYLFHASVLAAVHGHVSGHGLASFFGVSLLALAILMPLCTLTHYAVERVFLDAKARLKRDRISATL